MLIILACCLTCWMRLPVCKSNSITTRCFLDTNPWIWKWSQSGSVVTPKTVRNLFPNPRCSSSAGEATEPSQKTQDRTPYWRPSTETIRNMYQRCRGWIFTCSHGGKVHVYTTNSDIDEAEDQIRAGLKISQDRGGYFILFFHSVNAMHFHRYTYSYICVCVFSDLQADL